MQYLNKTFGDAGWKSNKVEPGTCEGCVFGHGLPHTPGNCELNPTVQQLYDALTCK